MNIPDYSEYAVADFLMDADFRAWVQHPTPDADAFWRQLIETHPNLRPIVEEAVWAVQHLTIQPYPLAADAQARIWQTVANAYDRQHPAQPTGRADAPVRPMPVTRFLRWQIAASLAGVGLLAGVGWYVLRTPSHTVATTYADTKQVVLPDGSRVTLNRNSSLTYADNWTADRPREVWVSGEAFFRVQRQAGRNDERPTRPSDAFIVHTDLMNVEVLGTQFDVNTRRGKARVVLNEGKVKLSRRQAGIVRSVLMQPGDMVDVLAVQTGFVKRRIQADDYEAWRRGLLRFEQTPLTDVIAVLEDNYGWQITLNRPRLAKQTFSATVAADQPDLLLTLLTESFGLHIRRRGPVVIID